MLELKGKLETTHEWTCDCGQENAVVDDKRCMQCGKEAEKTLRHFKLTPEPIRVGFRF